MTFDEVGEHLRFMANPVIARCPICAETLSVARLECASCGTRIEGSFALGRFHHLTVEQLEFLETFIKARGNFKDVERELGISYPTVRSRLDATIRALAFRRRLSPTARRSAARRSFASSRMGGSRPTTPRSSSRKSL